MKKLSVIEIYARERPLFLGLIRTAEVGLYKKYIQMHRPSLDIGCGDGFFAQLAFGKLDFGVDLENSRIDQAKETNIYKKLLVFGGINLPLKEGSIATVVSNCVLEHVDDLGGLLDDIYRVLRPGGKAYLTVMSQPWENYLLGTKLLGNFYKKLMRKIQKHRNLLTEKQWMEKFNESGFEVILEKGYLNKNACRTIEVAHYFSLPSLMFHWVFGKWSLGTGWARFVNWDKIEKEMRQEISPQEAGALFVVAKKPSEK